MKIADVDFMALYALFIEQYVPKEYRDYLFLPAWHCPRWHEESLMRHFFQTIEAALRIQVLTGVDVVRAAAFHDVGKLQQFRERVETGNDQFIAHELQSVNLVQEAGIPLDERDIFLIGHHLISYQYGPDKIWNQLCQNDPALLASLIAIATADTAAKGWTRDQMIQRPQVVAPKMAQLCEMGSLDPGFQRVIREAVIQW